MAVARRIYAVLALGLAVLFLSACAESPPGVALAGEGQAASTTTSTSVLTTAAPTTTSLAQVRDEAWDLEFAVELAEPDAYSFGGLGGLLFRIDGEQVRVTGNVTIGDGSCDDLAFDGVLDGDQFALLTTKFTVDSAYGDDVGIEEVTLELPPLTFVGDTVQATGSLVIVTKPWAPTKSGTFTVILSRSGE
jgi:hypothetical protein